MKSVSATQRKPGNSETPEILLVRIKHSRHRRRFFGAASDLEERDQQQPEWRGRQANRAC
jgi:hypothetical protein